MTFQNLKKEMKVFLGEKKSLSFRLFEKKNFVYSETNQKRWKHWKDLFLQVENEVKICNIWCKKKFKFYERL